MAIEKILHSITSSKPFCAISKCANRAFYKLGNIVDNDKFERAANPFDATHSNNSFLGMTALMSGCVILPRVITAFKRNPENKEATWDEVKEILLRDLQTVLVILFMLKSINAIVANIATKKTGIPMTTKPMQKLFDDSITGFKDKVADFISHPIEKIKIIGKNILDILHPTGGNRAYTNEEYISKYSNYSFNDLPKLLKSADDKGGSSSKMFEDIVDGTIENYKKYLNGNSKKGIPGFINWARATINKNGNKNQAIVEGKNNIEATIEELKKLKEQGIEGLKDVKNKEAVQQALEDYIQDNNNSLVQKSMGLNGWLRLGALIFEASYLGFGLPALNQRRLEKKYLKESQNDVLAIGNQDKSSGTLISKNIKAHEVKLYHNFIK